MSNSPSTSIERPSLFEIPGLTLLIWAVDGRDIWPRFKDFHYMSAKYSGHRAFLAALPDGQEVAFTSVMRFPHGHIFNAWREHRTCVLPDYQGLGIGVRFVNWMGEHIINHDAFVDSEGRHGRLYSRTVHPGFGRWRNTSPLWRATGSNEKVGAKPSKRGISSTALMRLSYSHEYIGHEAAARAALNTSPERTGTSQRRPKAPARILDASRDAEVLASFAARLQ
jgi:GNAT superfamily N-acetyltransferase